MTVKELIEKLEQYGKDTHVLFLDLDGEYWSVDIINKQEDYYIGGRPAIILSSEPPED